MEVSNPMLSMDNQEAMEEDRLNDKRICLCGCRELIRNKDNQGRYRLWKKGHSKRTWKYFTKANKKECLCACGCGTKIYDVRTDGLPKKYYPGHNLTFPTGPIHPSWKGGRYKDVNGYMVVYVENHPRAYCNTIREHTLIMEKHLGRYLAKNEIVHHINGHRADNRIQNLRLMTNSEHTRLHQIVDRVGRYCFLCNGKTYIEKTGAQPWYKYGEDSAHFICGRCYQRKRMNKMRSAN